MRVRARTGFPAFCRCGFDRLSKGQGGNVQPAAMVKDEYGDKTSIRGGRGPAGARGESIGLR